MRRTALFCAFLFVIMAGGPALAHDYPQWGNLKPGPYTVGFKVVSSYDYSRVTGPKIDFEGKPVAGETAMPVQISLWYPAKAALASGAMLYEEYLYIGQKEENFGEVTEADRAN